MEGGKAKHLPRSPPNEIRMVERASSPFRLGQIARIPETTGIGRLLSHRACRARQQRPWKEGGEILAVLLLQSFFSPRPQPLPHQGEGDRSRVYRPRNPCSGFGVNKIREAILRGSIVWNKNRSVQPTLRRSFFCLSSCFELFADAGFFSDLAPLGPIGFGNQRGAGRNIKFFPIFPGGHLVLAL